MWRRVRSLSNSGQVVLFSASRFRISARMSGSSASHCASAAYSARLAVTSSVEPEAIGAGSRPPVPRTSCRGRSGPAVPPTRRRSRRRGAAGKRIEEQVGEPVACEVLGLSDARREHQPGGIDAARGRLLAQIRPWWPSPTSDSHSTLPSILASSPIQVSNTGAEMMPPLKLANTNPFSGNPASARVGVGVGDRPARRR